MRGLCISNFMIIQPTVMKRIIALLFYLIYLNTAFGVGIDMHFCGDRVANITVVGMGHGHCNCLPGEMPAGCCRDVVCYCKTDHHQLPAISVLSVEAYPIQAPALLPNYISAFFTGDRFEEPDPDPYYHSSAYPLPADLCVLYRVFRL